MASEPDVTPLDDAERARRRAFVAEHRTAVFGYPRRDHGPSMSVVYYVMDGDDRILVSTMRDRGKAKAVARDPRVSLCVLDEEWPLSYLLVYATVEVDPGLDSATDLMMRISELMAGHPMPPEARADAEEMCRREHRLVLTLSPYATFQTPPAAREGGDRSPGAHPLDQHEPALVTRSCHRGLVAAAPAIPFAFRPKCQRRVARRRSPVSRAAALRVLRPVWSRPPNRDGRAKRQPSGHAFDEVVA